jgi:hypothetical protein
LLSVLSKSIVKPLEFGTFSVDAWGFAMSSNVVCHVESNGEEERSPV